MQRYTTLLIDADDTLLDFKKAEQTALGLMMHSRSIPFVPTDVELYSKVNQSFWEAFERGEIKKSDIIVGRFKRFFEIKGIETDADDAAKTYEQKLCCQHFVTKGAIELLSELHKSYKIYIITNGTQHIQERRLQDSGISDIADGVFVSEAVGVPKPEKQYFDYVLQNITETDKAKILVVGDSMSSDILGGINAGLDTCWYNPYSNSAKYKPTYQIKELSEIRKIL